MRKGFIDELRVPEPCDEKWDEMAGNDRVRFCSHCSKNVNNLSAMTPRQAEKLVRKSGGRLCVRYRTDPKTNSPLFAGRVSALARHGVAAGVLSASLLSAGAYAQETTPTDLVQIERTAKTGDGSARIYGYVTDPHGALLAFALVTITNQETMISHVQNASGEGFYEFKDLPSGKYTIRFEAGGFESREIKDMYISEASDLRRDSELQVLGVGATVEVSAGGEARFASVTVGIITTTYDVERNELVQAVLDEDFEHVKALVMMRAKINARDKSMDGMSPLHAAVETGNLEIAQYLLEHGAKINLRDFEKRTPMMMMDEDATAEMLDLLIRYGAKTNLVDKEKNNLLHHFAEQDVHAEMVRRIAAYGMNVNGVNRAGKTPLMLAAEHGSSDAVKALIDTGADVNVRTRDGHTVLDMIGEGELRTMLETYGAVRGIE